MLKSLLKALGIIPEHKENEVVSQPRQSVPQLSEAEWHAHFKDILGNHFARYAVKENVPVTELTGNVQDVLDLYDGRPNQVYKAEWGRPYDFVLYAEDKPKAVIMLGTGHCHSKQVVYLISRMFAKKIHVPYLGFYTQFPNKEDYVVRRIREELGE
jgi:hypothetical protein